jgi:sulfofructosephosphate aldolase
MVAMDQRESLASLMADARGARPSHADLVRFKHEVAAALGQTASGFLIDTAHDPAGAAALLGPSCGLLIAADRLEQEIGGPVTDTDLDQAVVAQGADLFGARAIKLLVIWRRDERRDQRVGLAQRFIAAAERLGVLSVLEPVVQPTPLEAAGGGWDKDAAIREAARELSALGPSLTKVQVPLDGRGDAHQRDAACRALAAVIATPWVVLSQGVDPRAYPAAVESACRAGASGFLAGRALWADVVGAEDWGRALRGRPRQRLERLARIVDAHARPWCER